VFMNNSMSSQVVHFTHSEHSKILILKDFELTWFIDGREIGNSRSSRRSISKVSKRMWNATRLRYSLQVFFWLFSAQTSKVLSCFRLFLGLLPVSLMSGQFQALFFKVLRYCQWAVLVKQEQGRRGKFCYRGRAWVRVVAEE
jgi:hypothetical protein